MKKKKFFQMSLPEKIARLYGYSIWTDESLESWEYEDVAFYQKQITRANLITKTIVANFLLVIILIIICLLFR